MSNSADVAWISFLITTPGIDHLFEIDIRLAVEAKGWEWNVVKERECVFLTLPFWTWILPASKKIQSRQSQAAAAECVTQMSRDARPRLGPGRCSAV
ncbi:hypothetical protein EVAR_67310_1 [Eumeta japonica]|uniref:Uncharacterized protein n=1 Tax=Eumeta variegata TaxID=151549 RepID=A0A4C1ZBN1_EUMVA|nr:hypothetical protein EVAR_67310_1 [Eumeta japonica]